MKILFIPHSPNRKIINRVYEFSKVTNSYFLDWDIDNSSFFAKVGSQISSLFTNIKLDENILKIPILFRPDYLSSKFNTFVLNHAITKYKIDLVVNANALLFDIKKIKAPVIYDLVDDHLKPNMDIGLTPKRIDKIKLDIQNSLGVVCVTDILEEKIRDLNLNSITIENGVYLDRFNRANSIKDKLGIAGKTVFGYIGGVEEWTGIDRACEAYMKIKNQNNAMVVVGDSTSSFFNNLKKRYRQDIIFTGLVSPLEVADYFKTIDIGLIPFILNDFTNNAFPIKAIEYGLANCVVISTPLRYLQKKEFDFIKFCEIDKFHIAMKSIKIRDVEYNFENYSWSIQSSKLLNFIKGLKIENS